MKILDDAFLNNIPVYLVTYKQRKYAGKDTGLREKVIICFI
ncbi:MAG: hypothetical protein ABJA78_17375 [Ferruginibacter sp.]